MLKKKIAVALAATMALSAFPRLLWRKKVVKK